MCVPDENKCKARIFSVLIANLGFHNVLGTVLVYDFWTPPHPINFVHGLNFNFFQPTNIYFVLFEVYDSFWAERCGQDRPTISTIFKKSSVYLELC